MTVRTTFLRLTAVTWMALAPLAGAWAQDAAEPTEAPANAEAGTDGNAESVPEASPQTVVTADPLPPIEVIKQMPPKAEASTAMSGATAMLPGRRALDLKDGQAVDLPIGQSMLIRLPIATRDIMVANPGVADVIVKRQNQVFLIGRAAGSTNVFFMDGNGMVISEVEVRVNLDIRVLKDTLEKLMPGEKIKVEAVGDTIYLAGSARSDSSAANALAIARRFVAADENLVSLLTIRDEQQVLLRVRVAEVQKSALKELGSQIQTTDSAGTSTTKLAGSALSNFFQNAVPFASGTLAMFGGARLGNFNLTLSALEQQGLIQTLAEPNLTAVSGETANLLAGGEYPIPVSESNGKVIIEYKPFGVGLAFTPVVIGPGRISLKLSAEASSIDTTISVTAGSVSVNGLKVRRAETTVEMPSGGSLMIAGMLQNNITQAVNGLPWIKDIPIIGSLFRSSSFQRDESELVVMVSAFVVEPTDTNQLSLPTDGLDAPSDFDQYLLGRLHRVYTSGGPPPKESVVGPIGYILE